MFTVDHSLFFPFGDVWRNYVKFPWLQQWFSVLKSVKLSLCYGILLRFSIHISSFDRCFFPRLFPSSIFVQQLVQKYVLFSNQGSIISMQSKFSLSKCVKSCWGSCKIAGPTILVEKDYQSTLVHGCTYVLATQQNEIYSDSAPVMYPISVGNDGPDSKSYTIRNLVYRCAKILTILCTCGELVLVDELLLIFQLLEFNFKIFWGHLITRTRCFRFVSSLMENEFESSTFSR